jgi:translocation and assembly module TamB
LGELRINRGKFSAYGQSLTIERGRLLFASGPIDDPGLDIRATRRSGEVLAGVLARGSLKAPELTLFSEPAMSQTDALSYLVLGHAADQAAGADAQLLYQAATSVGLVGGEFLAKKIGHAFGIQEVAIETGTKPEDTRLALGTYLSPRLYISYGIGLLEPVNTFRLRYTLSKRWQFQTESGTAAGADLLYTIER